MPRDRTAPAKVPKGPRHTGGGGMEDAPRIGDKVRVKAGPRSPLRGVIASIQGERLVIRTVDGSRMILVRADITNYSAAARLAWRKMPKRAGRPAGPNKKIRVSLRIDESTWRTLGALAATGRIPSREQLINRFLKRAVKRLSGINARSFPIGSKVLSLIQRAPPESR